MAMQEVNGDKHVVMEFLIASSMPREMFVQVTASRHEEAIIPKGNNGQQEEETQERWDYENVTVRTPQGEAVDLTDQVMKKSGGKRIIIDAPFIVKEEHEEKEETSNFDDEHRNRNRYGRQRPRGGRRY